MIGTKPLVNYMVQAFLADYEKRHAGLNPAQLAVKCTVLASEDDENSEANYNPEQVQSQIYNAKDILFKEYKLILVKDGKPTMESEFRKENSDDEEYIFLTNRVIKWIIAKPGINDDLIDQDEINSKHAIKEAEIRLESRKKLAVEIGFNQLSILDQIEEQTD